MNGLTTIPSEFSVKDTIDRLVSIVQSKGMTVFSRIDHAANAVPFNLPLRPTELLIFGNPKAGTLLMQDSQTSGIDLPVKALAWEDEQGKVWLAWNEISWLAERHQLTEKSNPAIKAIENGMALACNAAAKK